MKLSDLPDGTVVFKITRSWRPDLSGEELYEATRGNWRIGQRRLHRMPSLALGYAKGAIRSAYEIIEWQAAKQEPGRFRFTGQPTAPDLIGCAIPEIDGMPQVVRYAP